MLHVILAGGNPFGKQTF